MITLDSLLIELFQQGIERLDYQVPSRDKKILISLSRQVQSGHFLTENQAKLLTRILKENIKFITTITEEQRELINSPNWSQPFRVIEQLRKVLYNKDADGRILVEFTYNKRLRQVITDINKDIEGQMLSINGKQYSIPLTEKNLHLVVKTFKPHGFEIDPILTDFYEEISEILAGDKDQFEIFKITNTKLLAKVEDEIGPITEENICLLNDRSHKFQYSIFQKNPEKSLKNAIANRPSTRVWINSEQTTLDELVSALKDLHRLPLLIVFDGHDSKESLKNLKKLEKSLKNNGVETGVGIYFRFDNITDSNKDFNSTVSALGYNTALDHQTLVAGLANNKLPKFMISSEWSPRSVISLTNNFKNNKTSYYCDNIDLIVYYNDRKPLGHIDAIV
jgi:hypothetical protein